MPSTKILSTYRNLLRATKLAFDKDKATLQAARGQIRHGFRTDIYTSEQELNEKLAHANDIGLILRRNIVQGTKQEEGKYGE